MKGLNISDYWREKIYLVGKVAENEQAVPLRE